jgi:membrane associated rhomboid family serine protease
MNGTETYTKSWVMRLIMLNVAVFFVQILFSLGTSGEQPASFSDSLTLYFGLSPALVIGRYYIWQLFTYMFLHGGFLHLFLNMYALLIFGLPVEQAWGSRKFLIYYLITGIGAGITILTINLIIGGMNYITPTIGASGAVFGLLLAFGMLFPDAEILLFFFIPMKAKFLVILYGGIELYSLISSGIQSPVSHAGHLGGLLFGIIYFLVTRKRGITFKSKMIKARLSREIDRRQVKTNREINSEEMKLQNILSKIMSSGPESLTDDEYQYIRYKEIMTQDKDLCVDEDFDTDDDYCKKCVNNDACILRRIKKHM